MTDQSIPPATLDEACRAFIAILAFGSNGPDEMQQQVSIGAGRLTNVYGRVIRNKWGLWESGPLARWFYAAEIYHPDDMSALIVKKTVALLKDRPFDLDAEVAFYHDYWTARGQTPAMMRQSVIDDLAEHGLPGLEGGVRL